MCKEERKPMYLVKLKVEGKETFRLIPFTNESKYVECIYDMESKILHIVSNQKYNRFQMMPRLNDKGDRISAGYTTDAEGKKHPLFKEQRVLIETFYEYSIEGKEQILDFVERVTENFSKKDIEKIVK